MYGSSFVTEGCYTGVSTVSKQLPFQWTVTFEFKQSCSLFGYESSYFLVGSIIVYTFWTVCGDSRLTVPTSRTGSILEGPDSAKLKPLVEQVLPILLQLMKDPVVAVKVRGEETDDNLRAS